jgi:putative membrane protein
VAAVVIGLINMLIRPLLMFLAFPINILTLGLFTFVIDGAVLKMAAWFLRGFELKGWFAAVLSALLLAIIGGFLHLVIY